MSLTLSHRSALRALRYMRSKGTRVSELDVTKFSHAYPTVLKRWTQREFLDESWHWQVPSKERPLHILVHGDAPRVRMQSVRVHKVYRMPRAGSVLRLDDRASMVSPELLFLQLAEPLTLPQLVALGNELCGNFTRDPDDPRWGKPTLHIPMATSAERIRTYVFAEKGYPGISKARRASEYLSDHALSVPEDVLATVYSLPTNENGYGMGPVTINDRCVVEEDEWGSATKTRVPDLMFSFAPVGINYDGEDHLDVRGLVQSTVAACKDATEDALNAQEDAISSVRAKYVDDIRRNRDLLASGRVVLPLTKEDLYPLGGLDGFTAQLLQCANRLFGTDVSQMLRNLDDTYAERERNELIRSLLDDGWDG